MLITLAIIGIIYGALVAMVQPDVKRLVAYSSVSHMGFVVLGLFSFTEFGMQGALYQMLNHGVSTGALFLFVGFIYERRHTRQISDFGGLATPMPWFSTLFVIASLSSIGLPFLNGFVGEFLIMLGTWTSNANPARVDCHDACRHRRNLGGGLHALDVAARGVWQSRRIRRTRNFVI